MFIYNWFSIPHHHQNLVATIFAVTTLFLSATYLYVFLCICMYLHVCIICKTIKDLITGGVKWLKQVFIKIQTINLNVCMYLYAYIHINMHIICIHAQLNTCLSCLCCKFINYWRSFLNIYIFKSYIIFTLISKLSQICIFICTWRRFPQPTYNFFKVE